MAIVKAILAHLTSGYIYVSLNKQITLSSPWKVEGCWTEGNLKIFKLIFPRKKSEAVIFGCIFFDCRLLLQTWA